MVLSFQGLGGVGLHKKLRGLILLDISLQVNNR